MQHPDEGRIHAWLDGQLSPDESAELDTHVAGCTECSALVAEARGIIAASTRIVNALDAGPAGVLPKKAPVRRSWYLTPQFRAAAALLFVAGASYLVVRDSRPDSLRLSAPVAQERATAAAAASDAAAGEREAPPPAAAPESGRSASANEGTVPPARVQSQPAAKQSTESSVGAVAQVDSPRADALGYAGTLRLEGVVVTGAGSAVRVSDMPATPTGAPRIVRTDTLESSTVTVFATSDGHEVILTESNLVDSAGTVPGVATVRGEERRERSAAAAPLAARAVAPPPRILEIVWTDSTAARRYSLTGPVSVQRLQEIREQIERLRR